VTNLLGVPGALLADALVTALGLASAAFLGAWASVALVLISRKRWLRWSCRLGGWLLLTPVVAVMLTRWLAEPPLPCPAGAGGHVGAWLDARLAEAPLDAEQQTYALIGACALAGLLALDWLLWLMLKLVYRGVRAIFRLLAWALKRRPAAVAPLALRPPRRRGP
jgi:hypothetical protein